MFQRILVPLDGSKQAEQAIPVAIRLARASHGSILLLRVVDSLNEFGLYSVGSMLFLQQTIDKDLIDAAAYLAEIAHTIGCEGIEAHIAVFSGQVVPQILDVANAQDIEMIVLCSHGSTGFKRWTLGSVAHKVVHQSPLPVLLLHAQSEHVQVQTTYPLRALVPLDGSPLAEAALLPMAQVVAAMSPSGTGELHLMQVVKIPFIDEEYGDGQDTALRYRQAAFQTAREYLQMTQAKLSRELTE
ncbi:MAG: universal stress protein, partial [Ktedonobacteraceae bacterium]